jgi:hypothetical protein
MSYVRRAGDEILSEIAWPGSEVLTVVRAGGLILSVRLLGSFPRDAPVYPKPAVFIFSSPAPAPCGAGDFITPQVSGPCQICVWSVSGSADSLAPVRMPGPQGCRIIELPGLTVLASREPGVTLPGLGCGPVAHGQHAGIRGLPQ